MACGVPVIATKVGAFPELITEEKTGNLIEIADSDQMADATKRLIKEPKTLTKFSKAARTSMVNSFGLDGEADNLIKIYRSLI